MDLQAVLKARQASVMEAKKAGAIPGSADPNKPTPKAPELNQATGVASSEDMGRVSLLTASGVNPRNPFPDAELDEELASKAIAVFRSTGLRKFFNKGGRPVRANKGYFYAVSEEELAELAVYAERGQIEQVTKSLEG